MNNRVDIKPSAAEEHQRRLLAIVVGIDSFSDPSISDLRCAVNDAESVVTSLRQSQSEGILRCRVLAPPTRIQEGVEPTKANILEAVQWASEQARADDTVIFYFAGHGGLFEGRPFLMPSDVRIGGTDPKAMIDSFLFLEEVQAPFHGHVCPARVMLIDCCQNVSEQGALPQERATALPAVAGLEWRAGGTASSELFDAVRQEPDGWSMVMSCSPGERSLEDPHWGQHGIFSHFLAAGLSGDADLDKDNVVSLGELVQYLADRVPQQATAVISEINERLRNQAEARGELAPPAPSQQTQTPTVVWSGPIGVRLTNASRQGRAGFDRGVLRAWPAFLWNHLPYELPVQGLLRHGITLLYASAVALTVSLALPEDKEWLAMAVGVLSGVIWHAAFGLLGASSVRRWHAGGYFAPALLVAWHALVLAVLGGLLESGGAGGSALLDAGVALFAILCIMVVFVFNPIQTAIALAHLARANERVVLRKAFMQLEQRWVNADLPNLLAIVSAHPRLYQYLALVCSLGPVTHALWMASSAAAPAILARDALILVLLHWVAPWYGASYRAIRAQLLPEK